ADAEFHAALEHPHDLLVRMAVGGGVRAGLDAPPYDHALLAGDEPPADLVGDALLRDTRERSEAGHRGHRTSPGSYVVVTANLIANSSARITTTGFASENRPEMIFAST